MIYDLIYCYGLFKMTIFIEASVILAASKESKQEVIEYGIGRFMTKDRTSGYRAISIKQIQDLCKTEGV